MTIIAAVPKELPEAVIWPTGSLKKVYGHSCSV